MSRVFLTKTNRKNKSECGADARILHYYRLLHKELSVERQAINQENFSLLKSSQHRQALLQKEIDCHWQALQNGAKNTITAAGGAENFSMLNRLHKQIAAQIKTNLQLALTKKQDINANLGRMGKTSPVHRKNFPKFSYLSPPEIVDIRR